MTENRPCDWAPRSPAVLENQIAAYDKLRGRCPVALMNHHDARFDESAQESQWRAGTDDSGWNHSNDHLVLGVPQTMFGEECRNAVEVEFDTEARTCPGK
jgi:hypothetical protein